MRLVVADEVVEDRSGAVGRDDAELEIHHALARDIAILCGQPCAIWHASRRSRRWVGGVLVPTGLADDDGQAVVLASIA